MVGRVEGHPFWKSGVYEPEAVMVFRRPAPEGGIDQREPLKRGRDCENRDCDHCRRGACGVDRCARAADENEY